MEAPSLVLPLVYDVSTNLTQLAEKRDPGPASATTAASHQLKRFAEFGVSHSECSLFPAVRDLLANLILPSEPPTQVASSPAPTMQPSPAMQMHSPMTGGVVGMPPQQPGAGGPPQQPGGPPQPPYPVGIGMGQHPMMGPQ
ncbi:hypothetical protein ANN_16590 [Periplaneta americana]|uniref:Mediator of RNA polymerase II transcription subunit 14 C-terminal domain-containing protein n=2 Tax=Periplaneta americana TaxID=6978 RepID=A0ABQ8SQT1_PERAM|nr:hypothetical protein ANN_16590 [Periplaneta americana]